MNHSILAPTEDFSVFLLIPERVLVHLLSCRSVIIDSLSTKYCSSISDPLMGHFFRCHIDECFRCQETQQFTGSHLRCSERCCRTPTCAAYNFRPGLLTSSLSECTLCTIRQNITTEAVQKLGPGCYFCEKVVSIPIQ